MKAKIVAVRIILTPLAWARSVLRSDAYVDSGAAGALGFHLLDPGVDGGGFDRAGVTIGSLPHEDAIDDGARGHEPQPGEICLRLRLVKALEFMMDEFVGDELVVDAHGHGGF